MRRVFALAAPHNVLGARKSGTHRAIRRALGEPAGVIEMQVGRQHDLDASGEMPAAGSECWRLKSRSNR